MLDCPGDTGAVVVDVVVDDTADSLADTEAEQTSVVEVVSSCLGVADTDWRVVVADVAWEEHLP